VTRSVLISDGEQRSSLAVVRSLGRSGYRVYVCSRNGVSLAGASRYATAERAVASSLEDPSAFARDARALISEWRIDVFLPMTEETLNAVFANRAMFADVCIPAAPEEQFRAVSDKHQVLKMAAACGLSVPAQVVLDSPEDAKQLFENGVRFPVVVKPSRSVSQTGEGQIKLGAIHCGNTNELRRALSKVPVEAFPLLVQQRVVGPGVGIFILLWDGELVAVFAHRRLREKPPAGGLSVYRESIAMDPLLLDRSLLLLERFRWRGVAMIEYKIDEATGIPFIMEINGRFWGSLQLAIDAGVDFPSLLAARACGERVFGPREYKLGIRSRWEWGEVDYLLARLRRSNAELSLPPSAPGRLRAVLRSLVPWVPGDRPEVFRLTDPAPFLRETAQYFRHFARRRDAAT
jgi:predicted ATP-grasp superfamily ATP-dependent carboligase